MEAIDNNRFFYVSQWKSWLRHTVWRIPFVRSHLQLASANRSQAMDKWINLWQAVEKVALRAAQAALNRLRKKSSRAQEAHLGAPKGASGFQRLTASLKRCPDTKPWFFMRKPSFSAAPKGAADFRRAYGIAKSAGLSSVVPPGLTSATVSDPALKRRAIFGRPSGTWIICSTFPSAESDAP